MKKFPTYAEANQCLVVDEYDGSDATDSHHRYYNGVLVEEIFSSHYDKHHSSNKYYESFPDFQQPQMEVKFINPSNKGFYSIYLEKLEANIVLGPGTPDGFSGAICIYCNQPLMYDEHYALQHDVKDEHEAYRFGEIGVGNDFYSLVESMFVCSSCGWWKHVSSVGRKARYYYNSGRSWKFNGRMWTTSYGKLKSYSIDAPHIPLNELRRYLKKNFADIAFVNPTVFEKLIADCFRDHYPDCNVMHIGSVGDGGIDIKLVKGQKIEALVQVKRRSNLDATEAVKTIRELNGALLREGVVRGIVVTTAARFSSQAHTEASPKQDSLARYKVDLIALPDVFELLGCASATPELPDLSTIQSLVDNDWRWDVMRLV